jgi:hypothetical protein
VAIDGKAVRGAKDQHLPSAYLLSAFASRRGAVPRNSPSASGRTSLPKLCPCCGRST